MPITNPNPGHIILALMSELPPATLPELSAQLKKEFGLPVETVEMSHDVSFAWNRRRKQYSSPLILDKLREIPKGPQDRILGIVDVDLFCPDYDFAFGEAEPTAGIATLSTFRLKEDHPDAALLRTRTVKEAIHETGHLFDLGHCEDPGCVMSFSSGNLPQIDAKSASVCPLPHPSEEFTEQEVIPD
ncbi:archaemetzincin [Dehalogenimonas sp. THU2]|uniref:archaemetzincin n=1 Tax=Dehalogenimonas sp. THU2 TaxID=3151121 RepID=UPI003218B54A